MPGLLYANDLILCDKLKEYLKVKVGCFVKMCRRIVLQVNTNKKKVIILGGEEGLMCEVLVNGSRLEHVSEFKYFGCVVGELDTDGAECLRKTVKGGKLRVLQISSGYYECAT